MTSRTPLIVAGALAVGVALGIGGTFTVTRLSEPARTSQGIEAPDSDCVNDIASPDHPWVRDGWWVGYVDGKPQQMHAQDAAALNSSGHKVVGVWLCPPR